MNRTFMELKRNVPSRLIILKKTEDTLSVHQTLTRDQVNHLPS
jgi:hypothetical protein